MSDLRKKSDGMFFQKRAESASGNFFRDLPGRSNGTFHKKADADMGYADPAPAASAAQPSTTTPAMPGSEMGGGMYGTGKPKNAKEQSKLAALLASAGPGETRTAVKVASAAPSDWEAEIGLPSGMHRPAIEQPEALEEGGERFHSTLAKSPSVGSEAAVRHGVEEGGSMHVSPGTGHQLGKHAAPRFLGTQFAKHALDSSDYERAKGYVGDRLGEIGSSLKGGSRDFASTADGAIKSVTQSPVGAAVAAMVAGKLGLSAIKGIGRGGARLLGRKAPPKPGLVGQALGGIRKLVTGK